MMETQDAQRIANAVLAENYNTVYEEVYKNEQNLKQIKDKITIKVQDKSEYYNYGLYVGLNVPVLRRQTQPARYEELPQLWGYMFVTPVQNCCGALFVHGMSSNTPLVTNILCKFLMAYAKWAKKGMLHYYIAKGQEELKTKLTNNGFKEGSPYIYNPNSGNSIQLLYKDANSE